MAVSADELFRLLCKADDYHEVKNAYIALCDHLDTTPGDGGSYDVIKSCVQVEEAKTLFSLLDKRLKQPPYKNIPCQGKRVFIIGGGPCGLRAAIEICLLGGQATVVEMRDYITRKNVLHLWPFVIHDLKSVGAKIFYPKFCTGSLDHISIRRLQLILLKLALIVGAEIHAPVTFEKLVPPGKVTGWRARVAPHDHPVNQLDFDFIIGADGKRNTLPGFERKCFRGKPALGITCNFVNYQTRADSMVEEIGGIFYVYYQDFFNSMREALGIDLENFVYYKNETHYFVMTARKKCLLDRGVLKQDTSDMRELLHPDNIDKQQLEKFAYDAAKFGTRNKMPRMDFAQNHHGENDVFLFDFTAFYQAIHSCRVMTEQGKPLLLQIVGDTLIEPFWPTGSGMARGFLSVYDAVWAIRNWCIGNMTHYEVVLQREKVFQCLSQTKPDTLKANINKYTLDPDTRYSARLWNKEMTVEQISHLFNSQQAPLNTEPEKKTCINRKRKLKATGTDTKVLVEWFQKQLSPLKHVVQIKNLSNDWYNGVAFCVLLYVYRPDLIDLKEVNPSDTFSNNAIAFRILEEEFGLSPMLSPGDMVKPEGPDRLTLLSYLNQLHTVLLQYQPSLSAREGEPQQKNVDDISSPTHKRKTSAIGLLNQMMMKNTERDLNVVELWNGKKVSDNEEENLLRMPSIRGIAAKRISAYEERIQNEEFGKQEEMSRRDASLIALGQESQSQLKNVTKDEPQEIVQIVQTKQFEDEKIKNDDSQQNKSNVVTCMGAQLRQKEESGKLDKETKRMSVVEMTTILEMKCEKEQHKIEKQLQTNKLQAQTSTECCVCQSKLYSVETYTVFGYYFLHRNCFRCAVCKCTLRLDTAIAHSGQNSNEVQFLCFRHGYAAGMFTASFKPKPKDSFQTKSSTQMQDYEDYTNRGELKTSSATIVLRTPQPVDSFTTEESNTEDVPDLQGVNIIDSDVHETEINDCKDEHDSINKTESFNDLVESNAEILRRYSAKESEMADYNEPPEESELLQEDSTNEEQSLVDGNNIMQDVPGRTEEQYDEQDLITFPPTDEHNVMDDVVINESPEDGSQTSEETDEDDAVDDTPSPLRRNHPTRRSKVYRLSKSLRMMLAYEIQQGLDDIMDESQQLETRGIEVEKALRRLESREDLLDSQLPDEDEEELLDEWLEMLCRKQALKNEEAQLILKARLIELQHQQRSLSDQMNHVGGNNDLETEMEQIDAEKGEIVQQLKQTEDQMRELQIGLKTLCEDSDTQV